MQLASSRRKILYFKIFLFLDTERGSRPSNGCWANPYVEVNKQAEIGWFQVENIAYNHELFSQYAHLRDAQKIGEDYRRQQTSQRWWQDREEITR